MKVRISDPENEQRRYDECASHVAEPPGQPNRLEVGPLGEARGDQAQDADRGAHGSADDSCQDRETNGVAHALERIPAVGEAVDEVGPDQCLQRIAGRDAK